MSASLTLSFSSVTLRIRVELMRRLCAPYSEPPRDILERAKAKMEALKSCGDIAFYTCHNTRLELCWQAVRSISDPDRSYFVTVASGCPEISDIYIEKGDQSVLAYLTSEGFSHSPSPWRYEWFKVHVIKALRDLEIADAPNNAELFSAFARLRNGESLKRFAITRQSRLATHTAGKPYTIIANRPRREIALCIFDPNVFRQRTEIANAHRLVEDATHQLASTPNEFQIYREELAAALNNATTGAEALGQELPLILAAAVGREPLNEKLLLGTIPTERFQSTNPPIPNLNFKVSKDKMLVSISAFNMQCYDDPSLDINLAWIIDHLHAVNITAPMAKDIEKTINQAILLKSNLDGLICCRGLKPGIHRGPYLALVDFSSTNREKFLTDVNIDRLNLRDIQQTKIVRPGDLIAEIRFEQTANPGYNVYNEPIAASAEEDLDVTFGDEVARRGDKFYAMREGIPRIEGNTIILEKVLVHNGDVNLRSGNIRFDGSAEIHGSIDTGATVETTGDLVVHGQILSAKVHVRGHLTVQAGIVTGATGSVYAGGNIIADFIENSEIVCRGNLTVYKAILNNRIYVGGRVQVLATNSVCAGGNISCRNDLICTNLGFQHGNSTTLQVGTDWRIARSAAIQTSRRDKITATLTQDLATLQTLSRQKTMKKATQFDHHESTLLRKIDRCRKIIRKLESRLQIILKDVNYDPQARILIHGTLHPNVSIELGGKKIQIPTSMRGICIHNKAKRSGIIVPIEQVNQKDADNS